MNTMSATMGTEMRLPRHSANGLLRFLVVAGHRPQPHTLYGGRDAHGGGNDDQGWVYPTWTKEKEVKKQQRRAD